MIIATKGRPEVLLETLKSFAGCDPPPDEMIVVDGDPTRSAEDPVSRFDKDREPWPARYIASKPGLTVQRNAGLEHASGDVVVFVDDDVEVDPRLLANLERAYVDPSVVGATGHVVEEAPRRFGNKRSIARRLLFGRGAEGSMTRFGYPRQIQNTRRERDVQFMQGCFMSGRRETVQRVGFDERLPGYGLAEDEDFSYRLSQLGRLRYLPDAVVRHKNTGLLSRSRRDFNRAVVVNRAYLFRKNFRPTLLARAQFAGMILVFVLHRAVNREWGGVVGLVEGSLQAWRQRR